MRVLIKHVAWLLRVQQAQLEEMETELAEHIEYQTYVMSEYVFSTLLPMSCPSMYLVPYFLHHVRVCTQYPTSYVMSEYVLSTPLPTSCQSMYLVPYFLRHVRVCTQYPTSYVMSEYVLSILLYFLHQIRVLSIYVLSEDGLYFLCHVRVQTLLPVLFLNTQSTRFISCPSMYFQYVLYLLGHVSVSIITQKAMRQLVQFCSYLQVIMKLFFSSPEHEVLMVSYCGQWLSVVRRGPSSVVCQHLMFTLQRPHL